MIYSKSHKRYGILPMDVKNWPPIILMPASMYFPAEEPDPVQVAAQKFIDEENDRYLQDVREGKLHVYITLGESKTWTLPFSSDITPWSVSSSPGVPLREQDC